MHIYVPYVHIPNSSKLSLHFIKKIPVPGILNNTLLNISLRQISIKQCPNYIYGSKLFIQHFGSMLDVVLLVLSLKNIARLSLTE